MSFPPEQEHFLAVKAALAAVDARPYDYNDSIPAGTSGYTLVTVTDRFGGSPRLSGQVGVRAARITCRYVGTTPDNVREMRRRGEAGLREKSITVAGHVSTPIQFETAEPVDEDGDISSSGRWYSAASAYTYVV